MTNLTRISAVIGAGCLFLTSLPASAETYRASTFFQPAHPQAAAFIEFAEAVEEATNGEVKFEVHTGGALLPAEATLSGLRDHIVDLGHHPATYTPSELPKSNAIADLSFMHPDPLATAFAATEFNLLNPAMQEEWQRNGVVFGVGLATPPYVLMCRTEVAEAEDLRGLRIRLPGGAWDRLGEYAGAIPVSVPSSEMYTGLDRGSLDCTVNVGDALRGFSLYDVVSHVNTTELGVYFAGFHYGYNPNFWRGISAENRRILFEQMARSSVRMQIEWERVADEVIAGAPEHGVTVVEPTDSMRELVESFAEQDLAEIERLAVEHHGIENPSELLSGFVETVEKWVGLLDGVDRQDEDALVELLISEVYDKLDPETYGIW
jgi:TRAP-type transport system periplasmic protein